MIDLVPILAWLPVDVSIKPVSCCNTADVEYAVLVRSGENWIEYGRRGTLDEAIILAKARRPPSV